MIPITQLNVYLIQVAVKAVPLSRDASDSDPILSSLKRELAVLLHAACSCVHVCRYHGVARQGDWFLIVMALYEEGSLSDYIRRQPGGIIPVPRAISILHDICKGLEELHHFASHPVVVLDLKPDNVLIAKSGSAVLADFGISRVISKATIQTINSAGTFNYMPPEQFEERAYIGPKCDMWALACTLIHMITGKPPMAELNTGQILMKVWVCVNKNSEREIRVVYQKYCGNNNNN